MERPRFPRELERQIFLIALKCDWDVENLLPVSKRVHDWLFPKVFEVVILGVTRNFPLSFTLEKFEKYGHHIRALFLTKTGSERETGQNLALEYISHCPNLQNLSIPGTTSIDQTLLQNALIGLPLSRLTIHVKTILSDPPSPQLRPILANLTHLRLYGRFRTEPFPNAQPPLLRHFFPKLTHIAFPFTTKQDIRIAVQGWDALRVVVLWYPIVDVEDRTDLLLDSPHPRLVILGCSMTRHWEDGVRGRGPDIWELSEGFLKSRLEGE
ncbi:hypothetical protein BDN72DRAFT_434412 [Pluteus cervinus]|uniref:Uncharacterized protein n=1 Tax=Pluteus cervinus TaxID=181527 RepID=A0ACD3B0G6_9AGAR|nr:hypothetical protein BDN72DRAFT_434412 [Pluteus cervinus]